MAKFVLIKKTAFRQKEQDFKFHSYSSQANVRRPFMGIQESKDRYGTITVFTKEGRKLDILDLHSLEGSGRTKNYTNFSIQQITRQSNEKFQIQETWGEEWLLTYGKKPEVWNISGILVSSKNFPWEAEFWYNYDNLFRSTKLAEEGARIFMEIDNMYMTGYMINAQATKEWQFRNKVPFSFNLFVTSSGHFDTWQEEQLQVKIAPTNRTTYSFREEKPTNLWEYTQINQRPLDKKTKRDEHPLWRSARTRILDDNVPELSNAPHLAARIVGSIPGPSLPDTYADQLGQGFRGGDPPPGRGSVARRRNGRYTEPFALGRAGKLSLRDAARILNQTTSNKAQTDLRNLVGVAKQNAEKALGLFLGESETFLNNQGSLDDTTTTLSQTDQNLIDLFNAGSAFTEGVRSLTGEVVPNLDQNIQKLLNKTARINTLQGAKDFVESVKAKTNEAVRFPRPGVFLIP